MQKGGNRLQTCGFAGGGGEIRTRGPLRDAGFQDRWFQPLTHPSDADFKDVGCVSFPTWILSTIHVAIFQAEGFRKRRWPSKNHQR